MRYLLVTLLLTITIHSCFSQNYSKIYYNSNWKVTSKKAAAYYRNSGFDNEKLVFDSIVSDYFITGNLQMTGCYDNGIKEGEFIYYYPNGTIFLRTTYIDNKRAGSWIEYFENGKVKKEINYKDNKEYLIQYNNILGSTLIRKNACKYELFYYSNDYFNSNTRVEYNDLGQIDVYKLSGEIQKGVKNGIWKVEKNDKLYGEVKYRYGTLQSGYLLFKNNEYPVIEDVFTPLIHEPEKIKITEGIYLEPGQMIRNNYLLDALELDKQKNAKRINIENKEKFIEYFNDNFSIQYKNCKDITIFSIKVKIDSHGNFTLLSIMPKASKTIQAESIKVLNSIIATGQLKDSEIGFSYRILCVDELDYKNKSETEPDI